MGSHTTAASLGSDRDGIPMQLMVENDIDGKFYSLNVMSSGIRLYDVTSETPSMIGGISWE